MYFGVFYTGVLFAGSFLLAALATAAWRQRGRPGAGPLAFMLAGTVVWSLGYALELIWPGLAAKLWWARAQYLGIGATVLGWLVFALQVAGTKPLARPGLALLAAMPATSVGLALTSNYHGLLWKTVALQDGLIAPIRVVHGPFFWVHSAYAYSLLAAGAFVLVQAAIRAPRAYRLYVAAMLAAALAPVLGNLAYISRLGIAARYDLTPLAFVVSGLVLAWGLFRLRILSLFLGLAPAARDLAVELMGDAVIVLDSGNRVVDLNRAACRLLGIAKSSQMIGRPGERIAARRPELAAVADPAAKSGTIELAMGPGGGDRVMLDLTVSELSWNGGMSYGRLAVLHDVTERAAAAEQLHRQATCDGLTGLANRDFLYGCLEGAAPGGGAAGGTRACALLLLDIDRFREVNDTVGPRVGDEILQQIAARLRDSVRPQDLVARLGGDSFGVLLDGAGEAESEVAAQQLLQQLGQPYSAGGHRVRVSGAIGIACRQAGEDIDGTTLVRRAEVAMHHAKRTHSRCAVFSPRIDTYSLERLRLLADLPAALDGGQVLLHYQPQVTCTAGVVVGAEALARWEHPHLGTVSPGRFVPLAEQSGLIDRLWDDMLRQALDQHRQWLAEDLDIPVAVNLSAHNLGHPSLLSGIRAELAGRSLPPSCLEVESTETAIMSDHDRAEHVLRELSSLGVAIAVDDFGTGYSSLARLARLPVNVLKIDQSFIKGLRRSDGNLVIARTISTLAHQLGLKVVAEGIEDELAMKLVREIGCDFGQGYFVCPPLPPGQVTAWLKQHPALATAAKARA